MKAIELGKNEINENVLLAKYIKMFNLQKYASHS